MADLIEFLVPLLVAAIAVPRIILHILGLPFMPWWDRTPGKVAAWRRLNRWQYVGVNVLFYTVPMLLYMAIVGEFGHIRRSRNILFTTTVVLIIVGAGILDGRSTWKKIWEPGYDLPKGAHPR